jgi:hypothetical protein
MVERLEPEELLLRLVLRVAVQGAALDVRGLQRVWMR